MIPFTDREIQRAWRENLSASGSISRRNVQRLLLFYAVECGLKAVLMKRQSCDRTDRCSGISEAKHNINRLLDLLFSGNSLKLPTEIMMKDIKDRNCSESRKLAPGEINQMWRYGGESLQPSDEELEKKLSVISEWIKQELGGIS